MDREVVLKLARECGASVTTVQEGRFFQFRDDELLAFWTRAQNEALEEAAQLFDRFTYGHYSHPSPAIRPLKDRRHESKITKE